MMMARRHGDHDDDDDVNSSPPRGANDDNNAIIESSSTIAGGGGGGMTLAAHTIHTLTSTIADGVVHTIAHWKVIVLGQAMSIISAIAGGTNDVLALECGVSAPSTYNALGYVLVAVVGYIQLRRNNNSRKNIGNSFIHDNDNDETNHVEEDKQETESFREGSSSYVGDLHDENGNDEDFNYDDEDDDDLTFDESVTNRSSFFSLRRNNKTNNSKYQQETKERYPPPPPPHHHHHHHRPHKSTRSKRHGTAISANATHSLPPAKWYYYFAVALVEAQAFYVFFLAFRFTSFTFVYVSDALAIPSAMIFSRLLMKRTYVWAHVVGCIICIAGIVVNTALDMKSTTPDAVENNGGGDDGGLNNVVVASLDHVKGDIFAILGAILLGLDDVLSEKILDNYGGGVSKMLFMKGMFGALISIVQLGIFERDNIYVLFGDDDEGENGASTSSTSPCQLSWRMILLTAHVVSRALGVAGEMQFLFISEAALLNILLLTSDLFAAFFDVLNTGFRLTPYFCVAFFCIVIGIVLYESGPSPADVDDRIFGAGGTPATIEFRDRGRGRRKQSSTTMASPPTKAGEFVAVETISSSLMSTEHAGNTSPFVNRELT